MQALTAFTGYGCWCGREIGTRNCNALMCAQRYSLQCSRVIASHGLGSGVVVIQCLPPANWLQPLQLSSSSPRALTLTVMRVALTASPLQKQPSRSFMLQCCCGQAHVSATWYANGLMVWSNLQCFWQASPLHPCCKVYAACVRLLSMPCTLAVTSSNDLHIM